MRDIRGDLQDRASLLEEQINAHEAQFEKLMEQIRAEHEARLEDLKAEFAALTKLLELEHRRLGAQAPKAAPAPPASQAVHQPSHQGAHQSAHQTHQPAHQPHQGGHQPAQQPAPQPQQPLADFLVRKLNEVGAMSRDDLRRSAMQEGYFAEADTADRGVHATLLNVVKAGLIRQLPNGNFAPATVLDTIRLRRAM
ncbi:MAG TPA: hypothetical protein VHI74_08450 [Methyloceanibacter sp.]|jgi:hypothetical protein|nr:hypothetical protein [Methyloceanibacter sp.]